MNPSEPFIRRPVATTLLTLGIALAGAVAFKQLPVAPLPQVDFPTISVQAQLPGASPETMAATVAMPLERALGRISGVTEITSGSSLGSSRITLQFDLSRNIDGAARDVQGAINAAMSQLPSGLPNNPTYRKVNPADAPIMILALTSNAYTQGQMYDAASTILAQKLSQIAGIGQVTVGGSSLPAVRVELNPSALNKYGISLDAVRTALNAANANRPKGSVEDGERSWQIYASDQAKKAAEYLPIIVTYRNGAAVRLSDVAEVVDSVQDVRNSGSANGRPSVLLILYRQPGANIIETVDRVQDLLPLLHASIPSAINLEVMMERTSTIRAALGEVERALAISTGLVILVVLFFLRSWRATLIPLVAVPVSLVGTFTFMWIAGFSVNNLSLMALTVATGFVVDDAIVVLENISRRMEEGMSRMEAALAGAREVGFTVLSMTLSLIAVFIPILLMGGIVGRLFREFSITLSVAILLSLVVSLTTTPMMCARILRVEPAPKKTRSRWSRASTWWYDTLLGGYRSSLGWSLRHPLLIMLVLAGTIALNFYLYSVVPKGFFPQQDTGRLFGGVRADQGTSFQAMRQKVADLVTLVKADPAVENVVAFTGGSQRNRAFMFVTLKPLAERKISADQVVARLRAKTVDIAGAGLFLNQAADIRVGGRMSDATYQFTLQADELDELQKWMPRLERALRDVPELVDVNTDQEARGLQTSLVFDRQSAARLGLTQRQIDSVLNLAFGQAVVSTIYSELNQYRVVMEVAPQHLQSPEALNSVWIITPLKGQVPLSSIARWELTNTPLSVNHQGQFVAATLSFNLAPGVSLSQATDAVRDTMARIGMPASIGGTFQGTARAFQASLESQPWLILAALLAVYLVLGILYESLVHPITILSTLPSAGVGALLALMAFGKDFNIIALIGVILLIGIVKKNAIMMIDVALDTERRLGKRPEEAIFEACLLRFRPIMMTTLAALLGAVPLAVGYGYGAELRQPLGISIMGGLILSQLLTLYTTPVVYLYLDRFRLWCLRLRGRRPAEAAAHTP
jgi:multidrug efflux pump